MGPLDTKKGSTKRKSSKVHCIVLKANSYMGITVLGLGFSFLIVSKDHEKYSNEGSHSIAMAKGSSHTNTMV
jgi:hypothetical protein